MASSTIHTRSDMQSTLINQGRDLHLHHGPIDLVISAIGSLESVKAAHAIAQNRFTSILQELVDELAVLRQPLSSTCSVKGVVAKRMWQAASTCCTDNVYLTPMIAVAGAVADEVLTAIINAVDDLQKLSVNNGGDIALWQANGQRSVVGVADPLNGQIVSRATVTPDSAIGGVATSGRHGRSLSLGIADSVTVMAANAALADAAATLITNAVDLPGHPKVTREPSVNVDPNSDLGTHMATVDVAELEANEIRQALRSGLELARDLKRQRTIVAAYLILQGCYAATENDVSQSYSLMS